MSQHSHTEYVDGCYRCELSKDEAATMAVEYANDVIAVLRRHILPFCSTTDGDLPFEQSLWDSLVFGRPWFEWTIDAGGYRDWKIDQDKPGVFGVRYRGNDPAGHDAARACTAELGDLVILRFFRWYAFAVLHFFHEAKDGSFAERNRLRS